MKIKKILITGDDGYNSIGIRLLIHFLRDKYDLQVAATLDQMSGVGGHMKIATGGTYENTKVDGIPALCVDGYPADAVEVAYSKFGQVFDLIISGINFGANISSSIISSGTFAAAYRALSNSLAPRALVYSWLVPADMWYRIHNDGDGISEYLSHPGQAAYDIFNLALQEKFWKAPLLNVNFPKVASRSVVFTEFHPDIRSFYPYPIDLDDGKGTYTYPHRYSTRQDMNIAYDTGAILSGHISVTPCRTSPEDRHRIRKMSGKIYRL